MSKTKICVLAAVMGATSLIGCGADSDEILIERSGTSIEVAATGLSVHAEQLGNDAVRVTFSFESGLELQYVVDPAAIAVAANGWILSGDADAFDGLTASTTMPSIDAAEAAGATRIADAMGRIDGTLADDVQTVADLTGTLPIGVDLTALAWPAPVPCAGDEDDRSCVAQDTTYVSGTVVACWDDSSGNHCEVRQTGGSDCFGRCGATCDGNSNDDTYTRDCADHDACVDRNGYTSPYCADEFVSTVDDWIRS